MKTDHYKDLVDAQAIHTECTNRLAKLDAEMQEEFVDLMDGRKAEYISLQGALAKADQTIQDIARMNPQWFEDAKTVTTPYGKVQSRKVTVLEVPNPNVSIALLQQLGKESEPFLRISVELNIEALETLSSEELSRIRINRTTKEAIKATPAKVNLGKAAKAAEKKAKGPRAVQA